MARTCAEGPLSWLQTAVSILRCFEHERRLRPRRSNADRSASFARWTRALTPASEIPSNFAASWVTSSLMQQRSKAF